MSSTLEVEAPPAAAANENGNEISSEEKTSEKTWQKNDREFLLVVVTFLATVAFQAGMNPPGGVWQEDRMDLGYEAGKSIMATKHPSQFITFIVGVTVSMVVSLVQFVMLINELPYKRMSVSRNFLFATLCFAIGGMAPAYWSSVRALTPEPLMKQVTILLALNLVVGVGLVGILSYVQKRSRCRMC